MICVPQSDLLMAYFVSGDVVRGRPDDHRFVRTPVLFAVHSRNGSDPLDLVPDIRMTDFRQIAVDGAPGLTLFVHGGFRIHAIPTQRSGTSHARYLAQWTEGSTRGYLVQVLRGHTSHHAHRAKSETIINIAGNCELLIDGCQESLSAREVRLDPKVFHGLWSSRSVQLIRIEGPDPPFMEDCIREPWPKGYPPLRE